jgi:hypothetical protein
MKIKSLNHLKEESSNNNGDFQHFHILLGNGCATSSKRILYDPIYSIFNVIHEIDESFEETLEVDFIRNSIIMKALESQSLFKSSL